MTNTKERALEQLAFYREQEKEILDDLNMRKELNTSYVLAQSKKLSDTILKISTLQILFG